MTHSEHDEALLLRATEPCYDLDADDGRDYPEYPYMPGGGVEALRRLMEEVGYG
jgi:hypothetical protein